MQQMATDKEKSSAVAAPGKIVVAERGGSKVVSMLSSTKLLLEDVSDTLQDLQPSIDRIFARRKACREEEKSLASPNDRAAT